ncbi:adenylate/guanylate cyclase domain-containing protein [Winogradskyella vincentii]|uniref:adenylate cyclase n=1 Tax=Winogradskyella vincentii TaxID=2877122 RepID=A0ABS7Y1E9_9FLAO|nr:adenylate/guanylate cyclase domain-containing protein [Winogradskyella vincentii]MCA0153766.1 tetratricopeptide repeat protein [Winogradskyella vincentii]
MTRIFLIALLSLIGFNLSAQTKLDSLYATWKDESKTDYDRAYAYVDYINSFVVTDIDSLLILSDKLLEFGIEKDLSYAKKHANNFKGAYWSRKGDYDKAIDFFKKNEVIAEESGDKSGKAMVLGNIGLIYFFQSDYPNALQNSQKSLELFEELDLKLRVANTLNIIGNIHGGMGNTSKAIDYYIESLDIFIEEDHKRGMVQGLANIGSKYYGNKEYTKALEYFNKCLNIEGIKTDKYTYSSVLSSIGSVYSELGDIDKSKDYYNQALQLQKDTGEKLGISSTLLKLGLLSQKEGDVKPALENFEESLKIKEEINEKQGIAEALYRIGVLYKEKKNYKLSLDYCNRSYKLAKAIGNLEKQEESCDCLYENYKSTGNSNKALEYFELLNSIKDSLKAEETGKKLQQMEFAKQVTADSLATVEKERKVEMAHQEEVRQKNQTRNVLYGVTAFILLGAGGIYSRLRYVRKSKAIIEKEKDRSENLLLNILPAEIAEELKEKGKADARDFDMVSIIFTDFKGFTEQSEVLTAAELVNEINTCFEAFDGIMETYGIEKIKTIGDAYMAAGGLPVPDDTAIKNTVLAALDMRDFIINRKAEMDAKGLPAFEMRVGIHTGPVVAGIVGVKKFQYDIWGDTVNTASRMESSGEVGKVNISEASYQLLKDDDDFTFTNRGKIKAKGKGDIDMYFVDRKTIAS